VKGFSSEGEYFLAIGQSVCEPLTGRERYYPKPEIPDFGYS
jgi:hypothetical protein